MRKQLLARIRTMLGQRKQGAVTQALSRKLFYYSDEQLTSLYSALRSQ